MDKLRILVVEDNEIHRESARKTLADHDVTIVSSFTEARDILKMNINYGKANDEVDRILCRKCSQKGACDPKHKCEFYWNAFSEVRLLIAQKFNEEFPFDAVLSDLNLPGRNDEGETENVPFGFVIALLAAQRGAKYVAVITDANRHKSEMCNALGYLRDMHHGNYDGVMNLNGARAIFRQGPFLREDKSNEAPYGSKDWGTVLQELMDK